MDKSYIFTIKTIVEKIKLRIDDLNKLSYEVGSFYETEMIERERLEKALEILQPKDEAQQEECQTYEDEIQRAITDLTQQPSLQMRDAEEYKYVSELIDIKMRDIQRSVTLSKDVIAGEMGAIETCMDKNIEDSRNQLITEYLNPSINKLNLQIQKMEQKFVMYDALMKKYEDNHKRFEYSLAFKIMKYRVKYLEDQLYEKRILKRDPNVDKAKEGKDL